MDLMESVESATYRHEIRAVLAQALPVGWVGFGALSKAEQAEFLVGWRQFLIEHNLIALNWPAEYGGAGLSPLEQAVVHEEIALAGLPPLLSDNDNFGFQMIGNIILRFGTAEQRQYFIPRIISGEHLWCQGFSEPGAGSDLAAVKTQAVLDGDEWVINGQKIWTTAAHHANWIFVLARTDRASERHRGLTMLLVPMDQPGLEVRGIEQINGQSHFNEVFLTDVRTPAANVVGGRGEGWKVAMALLGLERGENATAMSLRFQTEYQRLVQLVRDSGRAGDPTVRLRLAEGFLRIRVLRHLAMRSLTAFLQGKEPGPDAAIVKLYWSEHWQKTSEFAVDVLGLAALAPIGEPPNNADGPDYAGAPNDTGSWAGLWVNTFAATIYAGASEIQRNIIGERVLGLPK